MSMLTPTVMRLSVVGGILLAGANVPAEEPQTAKSDRETTSEPGSEPAVEPALDGYCPACYLLDKKAVKGTPEFSSTFRGRVYYHTSAERKAAFDTDPDKYLPQFDGLCTGALGGSYGNRIPGDPQIFTIEDGKYYLFSSLRAYRAYFEMPQQFLLAGRSRFERPMLRGFCPVTYQTHGRAIRGEARYSAVYNGKLYYFVDEAMKLKFDESPDRYVPMYAGHDPVALSDRAKTKGDPRHFVVWEGRTAVFLNEENKKAFEADPKATVRKADEAWASFTGD